MICKECGAYNPDHATYCKVCAANLKDNSDAGNDNSSNDTRATRTFIRPSWTVPAYTKTNTGFKYDVPDKKHKEEPDNESESYEENMIPEEEETEESVPALSESDYSSESPEYEQEEEAEDTPVVSKKSVSKHSKRIEELKKEDDDDASEEEDDDEDEEEEEEFVPVFHRSSTKKQPPVRLTEEDDESSEKESKESKSSISWAKPSDAHKVRSAALSKNLFSFIICFLYFPVVKKACVNTLSGKG